MNEFSGTFLESRALEVMIVEVGTERQASRGILRAIVTLLNFRTQFVYPGSSEFSLAQSNATGGISACVEMQIALGKDPASARSVMCNWLDAYFGTPYHR
ncbi:MAG: hypothetical protein JNK72_07535 [Myxococcales bacterium]|nr:hypothetical protein [Myxococcales bacterium]